MTIGRYHAVYKIFSRILAARLAAVLPGIISTNQGAFFKDRSFMENILICQDITRNYHREGGSPRCMMKLDIRKAYDSLEWKVFLQVLAGLQFPVRFINWIMTCISTTAVCVCFWAWIF